MTLHDEGREWETLNISEETLAHIVLKARSFDVLSNETDAEDASDSADDRFVSVLDSHADNAALQELVAAIDGLSAEEQASLVTIFWIGRGTRPNKPRWIVPTHRQGNIWPDIHCFRTCWKKAQPL